MSSRPVIKSIILNNFKSYAGTVVVSPLRSFNAVIGPNGSGKSNFMDAVSFVMGEKSSNLRCRKLSDLVCGAQINKPVSDSASVTVVFTLDKTERNEVSFERIIHGASSEYRINNAVVTNQEYIAELEKLKINVKAKNFLVFQGTVESIGMKKPKEMTAVLEEVSGSGALKKDYEKLRDQLQKVQDEIKFAHQKKKAVMGLLRGAKQEEEEASKYASLIASLSKKKIELQLFCLYHNEKKTKSLNEELDSKISKVEKIAKEKEKAEEIVKDLAKEHLKLIRELEKMEQDLREMDVEIFKKKPHFIKVKEQVAHIQKKLESCDKNLKEAMKAHDNQLLEIMKLEVALAKEEKAKSDYEAVVEEESQSQGEDVQLLNEQVKKYYQLKAEAGKRSAIALQEMDWHSRVQKGDQDRLDNLSTLREQTQTRYRQKKKEKSELETRVLKLNEHIRLSNQALLEQRQLRDNLQSGINSSKERVQQLQRHLDKVTKQLGDAKIDRRQHERALKRQNVIEQFRSTFSGVYDRVINLCKPTHKRYNIAITKVFGRNMEAIVVDTEQTARQCISFLKDHKMEPETFLPLDYIKFKPVQEQLRHINDREGVELLFDLIKFDTPGIKNAILHITNNTVVCENSEDAARVAYELGHNAVTLEGTYYQKSGLISGGSADLARKAQRWDQIDIPQLEQDKEDLTKELHSVGMYSRKQSELLNVEVLISELETRLRYAATDVDNTNIRIQSLIAEMSYLENELAKFKPDIEEIVKSMEVRERKIKEITSTVNNIEDEVFIDFCQEIGVRNIRKYEDCQLKVREERKQKLLEFQNKINRIKTSLEFERTRDTQVNVTRWENAISEEKKKLKTFKDQQKKLQENIDKNMQKMDDLRATSLSKKKDCDNLAVKLKKARKEDNSAGIKLSLAQKGVITTKGNIEKINSERHAKLIQCKMEEIAIPLEVGSLEDILRVNPTESSSTEASSTIQQYERGARIQIDYSCLARKLRDVKDTARQEEELLREINDLKNAVAKAAPNLKATEKKESAKNQIQTINDQLSNLLKDSHQLKSEFDQVKHQRQNLFLTCFNHVSNNIDNVYKLLSQDQTAQAFLEARNPEEPYLDGLYYSCIAPGKRFLSMSNMSGGEKTLAALAILFAIYEYQAAPFYILDEIDAALDSSNISKVGEYIKEKGGLLQTIVISLKTEFYSYADLLIAVTNAGKGSNIGELDISKYPD